MAAILFFTVNAKKMFFIKMRFVENNVRKWIIYKNKNVVNTYNWINVN